MKKVFLFLLFAGIATAFFYCSKRNEDSAKTKLIQKTPGDSNIGRLKADDGAGGSSNCNCGTGFSSCTADCLFSDCCICWDPKKSEGACGCYFGIAKCRTALIGANSFSGEQHKIKLYHYRFDEYIKFLKQLPGDPNPLEESFKLLFKYSSPDPKSLNGESVLVNEGNYDAFYRSYTNYINTLTGADKELIMEYINKKSVKGE